MYTVSEGGTEEILKRWLLLYSGRTAWARSGVVLACSIGCVSEREGLYMRDGEGVILDAIVLEGMT